MTIEWKIFGGSGNPIPVSVPRKHRVVGSSIAFPFNRDIEKNTKAQIALALYREGLTINSVPFAFLSYFKVLNILWKDKYIGGVNELVEGIRSLLPKLEDDLAKERLVDLKKNEPDVPKYLYKSGRCAIAHAHSDPIVDPDDVQEIRRLSSDLPIIKEIAEIIIGEVLRVSRSIIG